MTVLLGQTFESVCDLRIESLKPPGPSSSPKTEAVYSTPESSQAKAEAGPLPWELRRVAVLQLSLLRALAGSDFLMMFVEKLSAMKFDPSFFSSSYTQCIGRGQSHKECVASLQNDTRITAPGPLAGEAANKEITAAISCMDQHRDPTKCTRHFEALSKLAGYEEEVKKSSTEKAKDFCNKAGYNLLALPVLYYGMKFIKIK
ncbi:unnamed protein product [Polarella glacialis]|uniref:Uncharacterized protein n=1 Tax=Polarella glacialis TaxID=89957 RepID=A0A813JXR2_POLGL|nr:unnamed protein product [Polarella glacialis]